MKQVLFAICLAVLLLSGCTQPGPGTSAQQPGGTTTPPPSTGGQTGTPAPPVPPLVSVYQHASLGQMLVGKNGLSLYVFLKDDFNKSNCAGGCATLWPPLLYTGSENLSGLPGALSAITRSDGTRQVTYNGMPLY